MADWVRSFGSGFGLGGVATRCACGDVGFDALSGSVNESMQCSVTGPSSDSKKVRVRVRGVKRCF